MTTAVDLIIEGLKAKSTPAKAKKLQYFFKTGKGQYGEGDVFWGVTVPEMRAIVKPFKRCSFHDVEILLNHEVHEVRMCGAFIIVAKFEANKQKPEVQKQVVDFYLAHTYAFNNWDLVDLTCYKILGVWLLDKDPDILFELAESDDLWEQRISIVATWAFIRVEKFDATVFIAQKLLHHKHDLIHKAVGWMLRELGKRNKALEEDFLLKHYKTMPRTMLRYAIEKFSSEERQAYLKGKV